MGKTLGEGFDNYSERLTDLSRHGLALAEEAPIPALHG